MYHLTHYSAGGSNVGDFLLPRALRLSIEHIFNEEVQFNCKNVRDILTTDKVNNINSTDGLIVGGGGLFLNDTNPNEISGWQWPASIDLVNNIKAPIFVLGVGYNRFRNQSDFNEIFVDNINNLVAQSSIFGLRNHGSINKIKEYLKPELRNKPIFHPCATTIISKLYNLPPITNNSKPTIGLNCAFDRTKLRYGGQLSDILDKIAIAMKTLSKIGNIKVIANVDKDLSVCKFIDKYDVKYETIDISKCRSIEDVISTYRSVDLMFGMRGHAQMIPFGCKTPIISLISHDKMKWFLDDIDHPEWGIEIFDKYLSEIMVEKALYILSNKARIVEEIEEAQNFLFDITAKNLSQMKLTLMHNKVC